MPHSLSVGEFSVISNFQVNCTHECYQNQQRTEKLLPCYCYKIVLKDESIVDGRFMHEKSAVSGSPDASLVVATPILDPASNSAVPYM